MSKVIFDPKIMGKKLKKLMDENGIKREDLADKLGISTDMVYRYETGQHPIKHDYIVELCQMFGVTSDYFYFENTSSLPEGQLAEIIELLENRPPEELKWIRDLIKLTDKRPAA